MKIQIVVTRRSALPMSTNPEVLDQEFSYSVEEVPDCTYEVRLVLDSDNHPIKFYTENLRRRYS